MIFGRSKQDNHSGGGTVVGEGKRGLESKKS